ncbi:MAG: hypothetical protein P4L83_11635 [Nevskia sp.]|nr:hypothetical protein [Nevskia sp.]
MIEHVRVDAPPGCPAEVLRLTVELVRLQFPGSQCIEMGRTIVPAFYSAHEHRHRQVHVCMMQRDY